MMSKTKTKIKTIDLSGLPEEQANLIAEFVDYLKFRKFRAAQQTSFIEKESKKIGEAKTIKFKSWPLSAKGKLSRREIDEEMMNFEKSQSALDSKKDPILKLIGVIDAEPFASDIDSELYDR